MIELDKVGLRNLFAGMLIFVYQMRVSSEQHQTTTLLVQSSDIVIRLKSWGK